MAHSLPYGLGGETGFWSEFGSAGPEAQKALLGSDRFARLRQSAHLGNQYMCFNCMKSCPVGV